MPDCLDVQTWRPTTPDEWRVYYDRKSITPRRRPKRACSLFVRAHLRPVDMYAYLRARFGPPNGLQNFLRNDDSDNLIHWDFNLKSAGADIYIAGHSREIHFLL